MNESFVENHINDSEIRNCKKYKCSFSSCGDYLAVSLCNQNEKADTLVFYDNENRLIEPQPSANNNHLSKSTRTNLINKLILIIKFKS